MTMKTNTAGSYGATSAKFLRLVLQADAAICLSMALVHCFAAGPLTAFTGLAPELLLASGLMLFPTAAFIAWTSLRDPAPAWAVLAVVAGNVAWVLASLVVLLSGRSGGNVLGDAYVAIQAVGVIAFAVLEFVGFRREIASL